MLSRTTDTCETRVAIECYVMAAIVNAREVYTDQKWLTWADHWIAGRDRSFASASTAHRMARQACDRESVETADSQQDGSENQEVPPGSTETAAEMAAWAAGLALVTASVAPDLTATFRRLKFALRSSFRSLRPMESSKSVRPSLAGRAVALARRAASTMSSSQIPQTARP
jgi:hypothetical protein